MYTLRRVFAFLALVAAILGLADRSEAQTVGSPAVTLLPNGVAFSRLNRGNLKNDQINFEDCDSDSTIRFTFSLANFTGTNLQIWAGAGCDILSNRITTGLTVCTQIGQTAAATAINPAPVLASIKEILKLRTLISGTSSSGTSSAGTGAAATGGADSAAGGTSGDSAGGSVSGGTGGAVVSGDQDLACSDKVANSAAQLITVYFLLTDAANNLVGTAATWPLKYKLSAPAPPTNVTVGIGEELLPIHFDGNSSGDNTINGYNFYCDPPPGVEAAADAGVLPVDGGSLPGCTGSTRLVANTRPDPSLYCGTTGARSKGASATGLVNGVAYNVAVATADTYYNTGLLSQVVCQVPQPVTGFFEGYRDAGGGGGGGFCSFSRRRETLPLVLVLGFASYWVMRRRRAK